MFSLRLLGGATIEGREGAVGGRVLPRRRMALLCALALMRGRTVSRDKLLALFWPESDTDRARHSLAESLYQIRRELSDSAIIAQGDELRLNSEVVGSDVGEFEEALERGDPKSAVDAYAGPLLDGFHLNDAPDFEHWIDAERDRLARGYRHALEQLAETAAAHGDFRNAVAWWRRLAAADPSNARITVLLMEALARIGDRAGALQQARIHAALLEQEFDAQPDPDVAALAERLRSAPTGTQTRTHDPEDPDGQVSVPARLPVREQESAAALDSSYPAGAARTRTRFTLPRIAAFFGVLLLAFATIRFAGWLAQTGARPASARDDDSASTKSIAVLPCANLSRDPGEEYFSDGLTEELIGVLSQVSALRVAARTSAFAFKGENKDIREIARALGVGTLLECSVRRVDDRVRVSAQLIDAVDGFHLWSETYEREGTDIFAIQSDLALRIAGALEAELTPSERARLARRPTTNAEAYVLYLKGRHFWNQRTRDAYVRAIEYYERAIEIDTEYAAAYAGLARTYALQGLSGNLTPQEAGERMGTAARRAVQLDDGLAEGHAELAAYLNLFAWDSEASEREYLRAIELDPSYPTTRHLYGNLLRALGRMDESLTQKRKALALDPLDPPMNEGLGYTLLIAGHADEALQHIRNAIELDSMYWRGHASLGNVYQRSGRIDEAVRAHERAVELSGPDSNARVGLARVLALAGRKDESRSMLEQLQSEAAGSGIHAPRIATVFLALDDIEGAFEWLELAYRQKHPELRLLFADDPIFTRLHQDPRLNDLLRRLGLPTRRDHP